MEQILLSHVGRQYVLSMVVNTYNTSSASCSANQSAWFPTDFCPLISQICLSWQKHLFLPGSICDTPADKTFCH